MKKLIRKWMGVEEDHQRSLSRLGFLVKEEVRNMVFEIFCDTEQPFKGSVVGVLRKQIKDTIKIIFVECVAKAAEQIVEEEDFIDEIIDRIKRKQLK